jgi:hypothetical protein
MGDPRPVPDVEGSEEGPGGGTLLFENDRVRVWEMKLGPGERSPLHTHQLDYLLVQIEGDRIAVDPHPETAGAYTSFFETDVVPGATVFLERGGVERAVNTGERPWREICIELKD